MESRFKAEQLKQDPEFIDDQDIISVVADPDKLYTKSELRALVDQFKAIEDRRVF